MQQAEVQPSRFVSVHEELAGDLYARVFNRVIASCTELEAVEKGETTHWDAVATAGMLKQLWRRRLRQYLPEPVKPGGGGTVSLPKWFNGNLDSENRRQPINESMLRLGEPAPYMPLPEIPVQAEDFCYSFKLVLTDEEMALLNAPAEMPVWDQNRDALAQIQEQKIIKPKKEPLREEIGEEESFEDDVLAELANLEKLIKDTTGEGGEEVDQEDGPKVFATPKLDREAVLEEAESIDQLLSPQEGENANESEPACQDAEDCFIIAHHTMVKRAKRPRHSKVDEEPYRGYKLLLDHCIIRIAKREYFLKSCKGSLKATLCW